MSTTNTTDSAWDTFAGTTATVDPRPDRYYCRVCGAIWTARGPKGKRGTKGFKPGAKGYNRCPQSGTIFADEDLVRLKAPGDPFIHLIIDGIVVTVQRSHLPAIWSQYRGERRNITLATEQGVDVGAIAPIVPAETTTLPLATPDAIAPSMPTPDDWARWASQEAQ